MRDHGRHLSDYELLLAAAHELPATPQATADAHIAGCVACRVRGLALEHGNQLLSGARLPDPGEPPDVDHSRTRLRAMLSELAGREPESPPARQPARWFAPSQWALIAAAVVAAVLLLRLLEPFQPTGAGVAAAMERDALPIASLTPGATWNVRVDEVCARGAREQRQVPAAVREQVLHRYGMQGLASDDYELDYLITPELGGAPDAENLWPQRYASHVWNAHVKDQLERLLPQMVCEGTLPLRTAQRDIASDWVAAYKKYFRSDMPLQIMARRNAGTAADSPDGGTITYPVWRRGNQPALELISFGAKP
jgi:hypothetical protein